MTKNITKEIDSILKKITDQVPPGLRESAITTAGVMLNNIATLENNIGSRCKRYPNDLVVKTDIQFYSKLMLSINANFVIVSEYLPEGYLNSRTYKKVRKLIRELETETESRIKFLEDKVYHKDDAYYNKNKRFIQKKYRQSEVMTVLAFRIKIASDMLEKYVDSFIIDRKCHKFDLDIDRKRIEKIKSDIDKIRMQFLHLLKHVNRLPEDDLRVLMVEEAGKKVIDVYNKYMNITGYYY